MTTGMSKYAPKTMEEIPIIMTQDEVALLLRIDIRTLKRWRKEKEDFPNAVSASSKLVLFKRDDIFNWLESKK